MESGLLTPGKRIGERVSISTSVNLTLSLTWGESRSGASSNTPEIANPAATLAIGAGIAWRVFRHPPIATALIGAGLLSLLRTPPARVSGNGVADYFSHAKERLKDQATDLAGEVKDQAAVIAGDVKDHAIAMAEAVKEQSAQLAGASKEKVRQWSADVEGAVRDMPDQAASLAHQASRATQSLFDQDTRDNLLLGTAGLAVLAALGVAYQRRNSEFDLR